MKLQALRLHGFKSFADRTELRFHVAKADITAVDLSYAPPAGAADQFGHNVDLRIADEFGCDTVGIQYQQGLKDLTPASDLAEVADRATSGPLSPKGIGVNAIATRDRSGIAVLATNYQWTDGLMTYVRYSTGYRAGGFNARSTPPIDPIYLLSAGLLLCLLSGCGGEDTPSTYTPLRAAQLAGYSRRWCLASSTMATSASRRALGSASPRMTAKIPGRAEMAA
mgnify:CR=1 FL=1